MVPRVLVLFSLVVSLLFAGSASAQPAIDPALGGDGGLTEGVWTADRVIGKIDAPLVIVEYASWTCPFCAAFHRDQVNPVIKPLVDEGLVRFVSREILRNWIDLRLATVTRCGAVDFQTASDILWPLQQQYSVNNPDQVNAVLMQALGLDPATFSHCMNDNAMKTWLVQRTNEAAALGARSTPSVFVNGQRFDLSTTTNFEQDLRDIAAASAADSTQLAQAFE